MLRRGLTGVAVLLAAALAAGCGDASAKAGLVRAEGPPDASERVTLTFMIWGRENEVRQERELLERFVRENPDIQIELIQAGGTNYQVKLATMLAGGLAPDVFMVHEAMFPTLAENGLIMPLDDRIERDGIDLGQFFDRVVEECRYDGTLYKLPVSFNTVVTYYNRDMFDAAGVSYPTDDWTWEDMLRKARRLTMRDSRGDVAQYGVMGIGPWLGYVMMMWQNGGELFEDGRLVVGKPPYLEANAEALRFCAALQLDEKVQPTQAAIDSLPANLFEAGMVAMELSGTWRNNQVRGRGEFRWDIAPPPRRARRSSLVFGGSPVIARQAEHPEAAWRLLRAMLSDEWQLQIARNGRSLPARRSIARGLSIPGIPDDVHLEVIFQVVEYARSQPIGPEISEWMEQPLSELRDRVLLGSISGPEVAEELARLQARHDLDCPYCSTLH